MWPFTTKLRRPACSRPSHSPTSTCRLRIEVLEDRCLPSAPGALDSSFGSGGIVTSSFGKSSTDIAFAVAVQTDGKIVVAGNHSTSSANYVAVARYNPNGTLDSSFGLGGEVQTSCGNSTSGGGLVLQPDGKILVGFSFFGGGTNNTFELVRYNPNGTLDTTFNGSGEVSTSFNTSGPNGDGLIGVALEWVNGATEIVAAGSASVAVGRDGIALARYNLNGSLDTSFGSGGEVVTDLGGYGVSVGGLAIQGDGQIVIAGASYPPPNNNNYFTLARYSTSGSLDAAFGNAGIATTALRGNAVSVLVQPDGKIVAGGYNPTSGKWGLERLNSNASQDNAFGTGGIVTGPSSGYIRGLTLQTNGKLVATGGSTNSGWNLARYNPDGSLDTTFGSGGQVSTTIYGGYAHAVSLQVDGKIVVAGQGNLGNRKSGALSFALTRYSGDPVPVIASFTASPNPVTSGSNTTLTASNITDANAGSTITQVAFYLESSTGDGKLDASDTLLGYATQTSPGVWTFTFAVTLSPGSYTIFVQAEDNLGVFSYAEALTLAVQ